MKQEFQSFWFGESLTPYEILCITSFLDRGHAFSLYTYDDFKVPAGTKLRDAREILPRDDVFFYNNGPGAGSVAAFANRFRYALLYKLGGWWVDMDVICLSDQFPDNKYFFARECPTRVNNAVLKFPAGDAAMAACYERATSAGADMVWGATGPGLLTAVLSEMGMLEGAAEPESCYAIEWHEYLHFFDPFKRKELERRTQSSQLVHLYNEMFRRIGIDKHKAPPQDSFLDIMVKRHQIEFSNGRLSPFYIYYLYAFIRVRGFIHFRQRQLGSLRQRLGLS